MFKNIIFTISIFLFALLFFSSSTETKGYVLVNPDQTIALEHVDEGDEENCEIEEECEEEENVDPTSEQPKVIVDEGEVLSIPALPDTGFQDTIKDNLFIVLSLSFVGAALLVVSKRLQ